MSRWQALNITRRGAAMDRPGCYAIFANGKPVYIGQSESVRRRIDGYRCANVPGQGVDQFDGTTRTPWGEWRWAEGGITAKVKYANKYGEQLMVEARLIRKLRPRFNLRGLGYGG